MLKSIFNIKLIFLVLLIALVYFAWNDPKSIPYPPAVTTIESFKQTNPNVLGATNTINLDSPTIASKAQELIGIIMNTSTVQVSSQDNPEEVVVDDLVTSISNQIKQLPQKEAQKLKVQFCQDVINQATQSARNTR